MHFLHIPKTGGSAVQAALSAQIAAGLVVWHGHDVRLRDLPEDGAIVFFLRHPLSRFVSGFNSRRRQGKPRYQNIPWSKEQAEVFAEFRSPNDLAESLSSADPAVRARARSAFEHVGLIKSYRYWFAGAEEIRERGPQILLIGTQENLNQDFLRLKSLMGLTADIALPSDDVTAHRALASDDKRLSTLAADNLNAYYDWDLRFYGELCELRAAA
jgi:hypothetical protein